MTNINLLDLKFENIQIQINSKLALVIIDRQTPLNIIDSATIDELIHIFTLIKEASDLSVVILTGSEKKAFVGGLELRESDLLTPQIAKEFSEKGQKLTLLIEQLGKPVIAAINGVAFDIGLEIALACSLRVASDNAKLGFPGIQKDYFPAFGGGRRLSRLIGTGRALELLISGEVLDVNDASEMGLINKVTKSINLFGEVKELAQKISNNSAIAIKYTLESFFNGLEMPQEDSFLLESTLFGLYKGIKK